MKSNLFSFCGTHGVGKTTIAKELEARGFVVDIKSVPRQAQERLGWDTLRRVEESESNLWAMQDLVLQILLERDERILNSGVITFVDRSPVDLVGYAYTWAHRLHWNIDRHRYHAYVDACQRACEHYGMQLYVPMTTAIPFVAEHNRGDEESRQINQTAMVDFMSMRNIEYRTIRSLPIQARADEVLTILNLENNQ